MKTEEMWEAYCSLLVHSEIGLRDDELIVEEISRDEFVANLNIQPS